MLLVSLIAGLFGFGSLLLVLTLDVNFMLGCLMVVVFVLYCFDLT